jgi:serine phosphatase RsbU (regulator of sigma subunit)
VLTRLNRQLAETHDEGFITCICARVMPEGEVTVANAGHLPPYRNGEEMLLEPDLPLGIAPEEKYGEHGFRLEGGDRLMLLSDGVVEARNGRGELFGFARTQAISAEPATAIAKAALRHGQADDITVLTLTRVRSEAVAAAARATALAGAEAGLG